MSLIDTVQKLRQAFQSKPAPVVVDKVQLEKDRIKAETERYQRFTETVLVQALDELNAIPGVHVQRVYTKIGNVYSVKFDFVHDKNVKIMFSIIPDPQRPIHMEVLYVYDMGSKTPRKYDGVLSTNDDAQKIISIFELGLLKCGPKI